MPIEYLEKIFTSQVAIFVVLAMAAFYLARENRRLNRQLEELYTKIIKYLELLNERGDRKNQ